MEDLPCLEEPRYQQYSLGVFSRHLKGLVLLVPPLTIRSMKVRGQPKVKDYIVYFRYRYSESKKQSMLDLADFLTPSKLFARKSQPTQ